MDDSCLCLMYDLLYYCPRAVACEHITNRYIYCDSHDLFTVAQILRSITPTLSSSVPVEPTWKFTDPRILLPELFGLPVKLVI